MNGLRLIVAAALTVAFTTVSGLADAAPGSSRDVIAHQLPRGATLAVTDPLAARAADDPLDLLARADEPPTAAGEPLVRVDCRQPGGPRYSISIEREASGGLALRIERAPAAPSFGELAMQTLPTPMVDEYRPATVTGLESPDLLSLKQ